MTINKTYFLYILVTAFFLGGSAHAHNSVVVVPLGGADFMTLRGHPFQLKP